MAEQVLNWCSPTQLNCGTGIPCRAYLCVTPSVVDLPNDTLASLVDATLTAVRPSTCNDSCGLCKWIYTISYDDEQLVDGFILAEPDIRTVFCGAECFPSFFDDCKRIRDCCGVTNDTPVILLLEVDGAGLLSQAKFSIPE